MTDLHHFLGSWQLFPEQGTYQHGERPRSASYKLEAVGDLLAVEMNWVSMVEHAFCSRYSLIPNGEWQPFADLVVADSIRTVMHTSSSFDLEFRRENDVVMVVRHAITPKGWLRVSHERFVEAEVLRDVEFFHRQMSVVPYATSVAGAVIRKTEEGVIRHQALQAMDEQTHMQLEQIRKQVDLLAQQAREIQKRKDLSFMIYDSKLSFSPVIGHTYYLYENSQHRFQLSLVGPNEWGKGGMPYTRFISTVKLLADHTWVEVETL
jgi:hypothetical protein